MRLKRKAGPPGTAVATIAAAADSAPKLAKPSVAESMLVPIALIRAAESVASKAPKEDDAGQGILVHGKDKAVARVVGQDGFRLFVGAFSAPKPPGWLSAGILLVNEGLKAKLSMIAKLGDTHVSLRYTKGESSAFLVSMDESMVFKVACAQGTRFPPYERTLTDASFSDLTEEGDFKARREWSFVGFNSQHLKSCGEIAAILQSGLAKEDRDKNGMAIRVSDSGKPNAPKVFDFTGYDGAVLVLGAMQVVHQGFSTATESILTPALKLTVAALRAHETRNLEWAAAATNEGAKNAFLAKAEGFRSRVAAIVSTAPKLAAIEAPKAEADPQLAGEARRPTTGEKAAATKRRKAAAASEAAEAMIH